MPKLTNPQTGETVFATPAGVPTLLARGFVDPYAAPKKRPTPKTHEHKPKDEE